VAAKVAADKWTEKFLAHLASDRGASVYTQRNYGQALREFSRWHQEERKSAPKWDELQRDDFRGYLRFLDTASIQRDAIVL
jgi:site-specific recombinase XerD